MAQTDAMTIAIAAEQLQDIRHWKQYDWSTSIL